MGEEELAKALRYVHDRVDTENQWARAVRCLETMAELHIALAYQRLTAAADGPAALAQHKMLFKRALRAANRDGPRVAPAPPRDDGAIELRAQTAEKKLVEMEKALLKLAAEKQEARSTVEFFRAALEDTAAEIHALTQENTQLRETNETLRTRIRLTQTPKTSTSAIASPIETTPLEP